MLVGLPQYTMPKEQVFVKLKLQLFLVENVASNKHMLGKESTISRTKKADREWTNYKSF